MHDLELRLTNCFAAVFPDLSPERIRTAELTNVPEWDSIASINLVAVIEEEFGVQIDPSDLDQLVSFQAVLGYLSQSKAGQAAS